MRGNREITSLVWVEEVLATLGLTATRSEGQFDKYDLFINEEKAYVEVKQRMLNRDKFKIYNRDGFMLENHKYNFLLGKKSLYCNTVDFGDCIICMFWNINKMNKFTTGNVITSMTTDFENQDKIYKSVKYVKAQEASSIYVKKNGEWTKITIAQLKCILEENI